MNNQKTWVVVASEAEAKIYRLIKPSQMEEIATLQHPESRLRNHELVSAAPGHLQELGSYRRSSYESKSDPHELEVIKFVKEIGHHLLQKKGEFSSLYVIAGPKLLGLLREHIDPQIHKLIVKEVAKDLVKSSKADIEQHLS